MPLKQKIADDRMRVFLNQNHFAEIHMWNGKPLLCVTDAELGWKRKNSTMADISWDNNQRSLMVFCRIEDMPDRAVANEHVFFDRAPYKVLEVDVDMGWYGITLVSVHPKPVSY